MTKKEAAIVSAYTGIFIGDFETFHNYIEDILNRPVFTHELGNEKIAEKIKEASKDDFKNLNVE